MKNLSYKTLFIIFFFLLIGVVVLSKFVFPNQKVSAAWWNDMWNYRKAVSIGNSGSSITNQYIKVILDTSSLITANKMQNTCNDIRVTNINGKLLTHFIDGNTAYDCNEDDTSIYVLVDSIPSSGSTIYIYYGNPSAINIEPKLGTESYPAISCKNILEHRSDSIGDSLYYITPSGNLSNKIQVTCDMTISSGGWIKIYEGLCTSATSTSRTTGNVVEISSDYLAFNQMRIAAKNWDYSDIKTTTETATMKLTFSGYYQWLHSQPDTPNPDIKFYSATDGIQDVKFTVLATMMMGYGNSWRRILPHFYTQPHDSYMYLGSLSSAGINRLEWSGSDYNSTMNNTYPIESGKGLTPRSFQEIYVWVKENNITLISSQSAGSPSSEEFSTAPIAYWKFDEGVGTTVFDSTSNQNNGIFGTGNSSPTWADESQCISGKCLKFDGSNDYIQTNYVMSSTDNFTVSLWSKWNPQTTDVSSLLRTIFASGNPGINNGVGINATRNGSGAEGNIYYETYVENNTSVNFNDNKWHYLTLSRSGSSMFFYYDGKLLTTTNITNNPTTDTVQIGGSTSSGSRKFNGLIDELKIYPYARTANQIKLDYNAGKAHASSTEGTSASLGSNTKNSETFSDGLVAYWKMDENTGTIITDSSGIGYTATFGTGDSAPTWSSGKFGIGISFDGSNDYINFSNPGLSSLSNSSISFWRKAVNASQWLLFRGQSVNEYIMATHGTDAFYHNNIGSSTKIYIDGNLATIPLTDTNWHHYVITGANLSTWTSLYLSNYGLYQYNGSIDEIRIYNRTLSPVEVSQLYNYAPSPIGYWDFEENTGTIANDKSGNNSNGTLTNSPTWTQGKIGSAISFNSITSYLNVPTISPALNNKQLTVSGWFNINSMSGTQRLISVSNSYPMFGLSNTNFFVHTTTSSGSDINTPIFGLPSNCQIGWHFFTTTWDTSISSNNINVFCDGIKINSSTLINSLNGNFNISNFWIGHNSNSFLGKVDDVKIYNYIRTQKQVVEDMNAGAPATSAKSMVAYYKFDEGQGTIVNNWGNGGSSLLGNLSNTTWTNDGKFNKALNFNGSNSVVSIGASMPISNEATFTGWFKINSFNDWASIFGNFRYANNTNSIGFNFIPFSGFIRVCNGNGTGAYVTNNFNSTDIVLNKWIYGALVYDGTNIKVYINGKFLGSAARSLSHTNTNFVIGRWATDYSSNYYFPGTIDEVKIYNYALTDEEVKQDYNQGSAIQMGASSQTIGATTTSLEYCIPGDTTYCASPIAEWNFEENTGTSAKDISGNNNNGTFGTGNSAPTWSIGKIGAGLNFDGVNDRLTLTSTINLVDTNNWTVSAWVKTGTANNSILSNSSGGPVANDLRIASSKISYAHYSGAWLYESGTSNIANNQWHYLSWVNYSNKSMDMYVDGVKEGIGVSSAQSTGPVNQIGGNWYGTANATIDQFRIYNYARTPAQIAYDYNKGGPVAWWQLDECQGNIAQDWSGVGNTGVINIGASGSQISLGTCQVGTSAAWTNGATGKINSSLNFDGVDDYITIPTITFTDSQPWSFSSWIKHQNTNTTFYAGKNSSSEGFLNYLGGDFAFRDKNNTYYHFAPTISNQFTHIIWIADGNDNLSLYVNGKLDRTTPSIPTQMNFEMIGRGYSSDSYNFKGQIDDVRIYNYALTSEQVKILYNGGAVSFN